ncbi:hypothetical protein KRMM14A1259_32350 [Krasilnikovia sp. MM14-A1259]
MLAAVLAGTGMPAPAAAAVPLVSLTPAPAVTFDGLVYTSAYVGTTIFVGGSFRNAIVNGRLVVRKRLAALDARTGDLLPWAPVADGTVFGLTGAGTSVYVTGKFKTIGGQARPGLAAINAKTGAVGTLKHTVTGTGNVLTAGGGRLFLGGAFSAIDGRAEKNLAAFRLTDGALDTTFRGDADGQVKALNVAGSRLYVGGGFKRLNGVSLARFGALALADGQVDAGFRPGTPYPVGAISVTPDRVFAGQGGPGGRVAAYKPDGGFLWSSVTDGDVQAMTYLRGVVYAGGHWDVACPKPSATATSWCPATLRSQPKLIALDAATGVLQDWNPRSNGKWGVLTMDANALLGSIAVGGEFTAFAGKSTPHFAQFCFYACSGLSGR